MAKRQSTKTDVPRGPGGKWLPGTSPNPGGLPKGVAEVRRLALSKAPDCIAKLWAIACDGDRDAARVAAIREILDRAVGKPVQAVEVSGGQGQPIQLDLSGLKTEELLELRTILGKARRGDR